MKWIVVLAIVVSLFIFFPRKMLGGLGVLVFTGGVIAGSFYYQEWSERKVVEAVDVSVEYSLSFCEESMPLKVRIDNLSEKTVTMVEWNIAVHQVGFSDDLSVPGYQIYSQSKILKPKSHWRGCVNLPGLKREVSELSALVFSIKDKDAMFE